MTGIDIDAILGEQTPHPLTYKKVTFDLPAELPGEALAPFFADDLGLIDIVADVMGAERKALIDPETGRPKIDPETGLPVQEGWMDLVFRVLKSRPKLPLELLAAGRESLSVLLNTEAERADEFFALKPSVNAYWVIATHLSGLYGFDLSDFFESPVSAPGETDGGESSKATSPDTSPESTPEGSSDARLIPASSEPAASSS